MSQRLNFLFNIFLFLNILFIIFNFVINLPIFANQNKGLTDIPYLGVYISEIYYSSAGSNYFNECGGLNRTNCGNDKWFEISNISDQSINLKNLSFKNKEQSNYRDINIDYNLLPNNSIVLSFLNQGSLAYSNQNFWQINFLSNFSNVNAISALDNTKYNINLGLYQKMSDSSYLLLDNKNATNLEYQNNLDRASLEYCYQQSNYKKATQIYSNPPKYEDNQILYNLYGTPNNLTQDCLINSVNQTLTQKQDNLNTETQNITVDNNINQLNNNINNSIINTNNIVIENILVEKTQDTNIVPINTITNNENYIIIDSPKIIENNHKYSENTATELKEYNNSNQINSLLNISLSTKNENQSLSVDSYINKNDKENLVNSNNNFEIVNSSELTFQTNYIYNTNKNYKFYEKNFWLQRIYKSDFYKDNLKTILNTKNLNKYLFFNKFEIIFNYIFYILWHFKININKYKILTKLKRLPVLNTRVINFK